MLKQQTRERLQALVQNPEFVGSVHISDKKYLHASDKGKPTFRVSVDIHADGFNIFTILALDFPDMKVGNVESYETDQGDFFTFGSFARATIEEATVNIWATYGRKEKPSAPTESIEELTQPEYTTTWSPEEILRQEASHV